MYECIYGFTPFACDDRQETKLKILNHKKTLHFPTIDRALEPSIAALDLMMQILVEKEKRLCSMQYQANDYGRKFQGAQLVRCRLDKTLPDYPGYFVFPNDADDIKRHPFFKGMDFKRIRDYRAPNIPVVKHSLDTKYFDDEGPVSDLEPESSCEEEDALPVQKLRGQHQQEAQNIIPSGSMNLGSRQTPEAVGPSHAPGYLPAPQCSPVPTLVDFAVQVDGPLERIVPVASKTKKKEKKRARDIILRDPSTSKQAMRIRKATAFLGYDYRKPVDLEHLLEEAIIEDQVAQAVRRHRERQYASSDRVSTNPASFKVAGHVHPNIRTRM